MPTSKAKKAPDVTTRYEVCRLDGSDSRMFPDGSTLEDAKAGRDLLNKQCALGITEPSQHHPNGQILNAHVSGIPTPVRHVGMGGSGIHLPDVVVDQFPPGSHLRGTGAGVVTTKGGELCRVAEYEVRTHVAEVA